MKKTPCYYSILTANVRYDKDLNPNAKLLYSEISALSNNYGYCDASNNYFAELYNVDPRTVRRWISQLNKKKYIAVEIIFKPGTKQVIKRKLFIVNDPRKESKKENEEENKNFSDLQTKMSSPSCKNDQKPTDKNVLYNNTSVNNTSVSKEKTHTKTDFEGLKEDIKTRYPYYQKFDLKYYFERVCLYLMQNPSKQITDFTAYVVSFMLGDEQQKKAKLKESSGVTVLGYSKGKPKQRQQQFKTHLFNMYSSRFKISELKAFYSHFSQVDNTGKLLIEKSRISNLETLINAFLNRCKQS